MNIIMLAVVGSLVFLTIAVAIARSRFGAAGVAWFCVVAVFVSGFLQSAVLLSQGLLTMVLAFACIGLRLKPEVMVWSSVAATAIGLGVPSLMDHFEHRRIQVLREEFPYESMADRLVYEARASTTSSPLPLSNQVEKRLEDFDNRGSSNTRRYVLQALHERKRREFKEVVGFGNVRMLPISKGRIELPDAEPIPVPSKPESTSDPGSPVPSADGQLLDQARPDEGELLSMHWFGLEDFLEAERMGYVKDRDHVAGFEPHRFLNMPTLALGKQIQAQWTMTRLELVSLLKHEVPVAYVSDHLPQMDELRDAPTRPLDDFERRALDQLRSDEDLVIDDAPNRIRMVGSLRAGKDCMECHSVRRGELLGAFSYELVPTRPAPVKQREERRAEPGA